MKNNTNRVITGWEIYFADNGTKVSKLRSTRREANSLRDTIKRQKKKYLGMRRLDLVEVA